MTATAKAKLPNERTVTITRIFDAPRELVFKMWTEPKHMAQWWGPHHFTNPVCELDVRPGGKIRIDMRGPDGTVHPMVGTFNEVVPPEMLVFVAIAQDQQGKPLLESVTTVTFVAQGNRTKLTVHASAVGLVPFAPQMLAGMEVGWTQSLDKLANLVARASGREDADDLAEINAILGDRSNALFCKSVDLAVKHLADDLVSYDLAPPLEHIGTGKAALKAWFDTWDGPIGWALDDLRIAVGGDIAYARGLGHMTGTKTGGEKIDLWVRCTTCFGRQGGAWKITHEHTSVPFLMDGSYKAAVDLKPQ